MILTFLQQRSQSVIHNGCGFFYEFTGSEAGRAISVPKKKPNHLIGSTSFDLVELRGFEPLTSTMRM